jgi:hypothetical protein
LIIIFTQYIWKLALGLLLLLLLLLLFQLNCILGQANLDLSRVIGLFYSYQTQVNFLSQNSKINKKTLKKSLEPGKKSLRNKEY